MHQIHSINTNCEVCGEKFVTQNVRKVCCSNKCNQKKWRDRKVAHKVGKCVICQKEFVKRNGSQVCCGVECRKEYERAQQKIRNQKWKAKQQEKQKEMQKQANAKTNHETIAEIAIAAKKEGLSYGQYVVKYMGK